MKKSLKNLKISQLYNGEKYEYKDNFFNDNDEEFEGSEELIDDFDENKNVEDLQSEI